MPNKHATMQRGGPKGHGGGNKAEGQDGEIGQHTETTGRGRSESSPGHLKKAAGAQSARDFAPGHLRHADRGAKRP